MLMRDPVLQKLNWRSVAKSGVAATPVIEHLDVVEQIGNCLGSGSVARTMHPFVLQAIEEALGRGVVPAVDPVAHQAGHVVQGELALEGPIGGFFFRCLFKREFSSGRLLCPIGSFFFHWPIQEGFSLWSAVLFWGRVDRPDTSAPPSPRCAASGSLSPSVYARRDGVQPEIPAHLKRRGGRGGGEKSGPRSPYCGP